MKKFFADRPNQYAFFLAFSYLVLAISWILITTWLAHMSSRTVEEMATIETLKGIGFMIATSLATFFFSRFAFRRIAAGAHNLLLSQQKLIAAERESLIGQLSASIAHDVANLLTVQRLHLERLKSFSDLPEAVEDSVVKIDRSTERLTELANRLKSAGQNPRRKPVNFDFSATLAENVQLMRSHPLLQHCQIEFVGPARLMLRGYPLLIHQLSMNLILNAGEATHGHGLILLEVLEGESGWVTLNVHDNGPGIPVAMRQKIFDAFFTTKATGSGLGLLSVKACVELHEGKITIHESPLGGALFQVQLPNLDDELNALNKPSEHLNKITLGPRTPRPPYESSQSSSIREFEI